MLDPVFDLPEPRSLILRMDITNTCNLDCIGCFLVDGRKIMQEPAAAMKIEIFEKIATEVFPYLKSVALSCEAEPTLHPQFGRVMQIIADKTERNTKLPVRMTTNATLLTGGRLDAIFDAGIFGLSISIDGFTPETFAKVRKKGEIEKVFEAMDEIVRRKAALGRGAMDLPRLFINYTLMKSTLSELIPLIEYSRRWPLEGLVVTHVYSSGTRDMSYESLADWPEQSNRVLLEAEQLCRQYGIPFQFPLLFPPITAKPSFWQWFRRNRQQAAVSPPIPVPVEPELACAAPWNMIKIRWDGSVHPCDLWNSTQPFGTLQRQSFHEIWMSQKYTDLRSSLFRNMPTFEQCRKCDRVSQDNLEKRKIQTPLAHTSVHQVK
jgi:radical SAM protein with 4Fe4S-binding SPASM domain